MGETREAWHLGHRPALDGVRGVAIGLVLFGHAFAWSATPAAGSAGVTVFFVLSGFLITSLLLEEINRTGRVSMLRFYERRARRLLPALALTIVAYLALAPLFWPAGFSWRALVGALTYSTNWLAIGHKDMGLAYMWSLAIEEQFYIVWPVVLVLLIRLPRRLLVGLLIGLAVATLQWRAHLVDALAQPADRLYFGTDARADALLLGCALAVFMHGRRERKVSPASAIGGLVLVATCSTMAGYGFFVAMPFFVSVGTVAVIYGAVQGGARWLEWRPLRVMGERSYGLYLLHPIVGVAPMWILGSESVWLRVFVMLPVSWVAASLSYRYVEAPFRRSSASRLERRRNAPALEVAERKVG